MVTCVWHKVMTEIHDTCNVEYTYYTLYKWMYHVNPLLVNSSIVTHLLSFHNQSILSIHDFLSIHLWTCFWGLVFCTWPAAGVSTCNSVNALSLYPLTLECTLINGTVAGIILWYLTMIPNMVLYISIDSWPVVCLFTIHHFLYLLNAVNALGFY